MWPMVVHLSARSARYQQRQLVRPDVEIAPPSAALPVFGRRQAFRCDMSQVMPPGKKVKVTVSCYVGNLRSTELNGVLVRWEEGRVAFRRRSQRPA
jgi:hypothetical protein